MVGGSENALGGGKNISIEGILDKHHKILEPISESALRDEKMTNNTFSLPFFNLKLPSTIAGLRVYLANSPQVTRRDKRDETPDKKKEGMYNQDKEQAEAPMPAGPDATNLAGPGNPNASSAPAEEPLPPLQEGRRNKSRQNVIISSSDRMRRLAGLD
jgi:hypothetical protein